MNTRAASLLVPVLMAALAGCASEPTPAEQEASFRPFARKRIGDVTLARFLALRTPLLVHGQCGVTFTASNASWSGKPAFGSALAVTSDGYFLTTAHCCDPGPVCLVARLDGQPKKIRTRVVWNGRKEDGCDLAIIHVPHAHFDNVFEWARVDDASEKAQVVCAGWSAHSENESSLNVGLAVSGGHVLYVLSRPEAISSTAGALSFTIVAHDAPTAHGYSGGPLATLEGRLVGVNVGGWTPTLAGIPISSEQSIAFRPDPAWIARKIDEDRRARAKPPGTAAAK